MTPDRSRWTCCKQSKGWRGLCLLQPLLLRSEISLFWCTSCARDFYSHLIRLYQDRRISWKCKRLKHLFWMILKKNLKMQQCKILLKFWRYINVLWKYSNIPVPVNTISIWNVVSRFVDEPKSYSKKIICFWSGRIQNMILQDVDPSLCTHLIYDGIYWADMLQTDFNTTLEEFAALKDKNRDLKTLVKLEGSHFVFENYEDYPYKFKASQRNKFVRNVIQYLRRYNVDGLNLHWTFPVVRMSNPVEEYQQLMQVKITIYGYFLKKKSTLSAVLKLDYGIIMCCSVVRVQIEIMDCYCYAILLYVWMTLCMYAHALA